MRQWIRLSIEISLGTHRWRRETHGNPIVDFDDDSGQMRWFLPSLMGAIEMPRSGHHHVGLQHEVSRETNQQVFAYSIDR